MQAQNRESSQCKLGTKSTFPDILSNAFQKGSVVATKKQECFSVYLAINGIMTLILMIFIFIETCIVVLTLNDCAVHPSKT